MSTKPLADGFEAPSLEEQFIDLVCDDPRLLAAEFEEIVAEWDEAPPGRPGHSLGGRDRGREAASLASGVSDVARSVPPRHPGIGGWSRQRSPPSMPRS